MRAPTLRDMIERERAGEDPVEIMREAGYTDAQIDGWRAAMAKCGEALQRLAEWVESADPRADWLRLWLPVSYTERERLDALRRILDRLHGPPIHPRRWAENRERFMDALADLGVTVAELADARGWDAARTITDDLTPSEAAAAHDDLVRALRSNLERLICDDLLGPGWRRKATVNLEHVADVGSEPWAALETHITLDALMGGAGLTAGERAALDMDRQGYSTREIADALDTTEVAVRRRRSDAGKKIRGAFGDSA